MKSRQTQSGDLRKQAISIRMSRSDVRNIKRISQRLGARDSDVIRFAIKLMLARLSPLQDPSVGGRNLVPVFLEWGSELMRHFDLDAPMLSQIINDEVPEERRVEADDIQLIAISALQGSFTDARSGRVRGLARSSSIHESRPDSNHAVAANGADEVRDERAPGAGSDLRTYLIDKYLTYRPGSRGFAPREEL